MSALILAEHDGAKLAPEVSAVVTALAKVKTDVVLLVAADDALSLATLTAQAASLVGVARVLGTVMPTATAFLTENVVAQIEPLLKSGAYSHFAMSSSYTGKRIVSYLAGRLDSDASFDVVSVIDADTFVRAAYAGNLWLTERQTSPVKLLTFRVGAFHPAPFGAAAAPIETLAAVPFAARVRCDLQVPGALDKRLDLARAKTVIGIGAGVTREMLPDIERLADKWNAAIGATRAAVEMGLASSSMMLGQTAKAIAPDLYLAVAISGAVQHMAGVKDSRVIVAINHDANAPIFRSADYGIVGDAQDVVRQLIANRVAGLES